MKYIVITTINSTTRAIETFAAKDEWKLLLVGDRKTPTFDGSGSFDTLSVKDQSTLTYRVLDTLPFDHYARKNLGYLRAIEQRATVIADTDDDNLPYDNWGQVSFGKFEGKVLLGPPICNVYSYFTDEAIWPRGIPLTHICTGRHLNILDDCHERVWVWQGLSDHEPDVDAIYRLVFGKSVKFQQKPPIVLFPGIWSPFNSQNTIWHINAFPYLYLPVTVSFRHTDILRSYVAQRGLWALGAGIGFSSATTFQDRNRHDLMQDFVSEVEVYVKAERTIEMLSNLDLIGNPLEDIKIMYEALIRHGIVEDREIESVKAWVEDLVILGWSSIDSTHNS